MKKREKFGLKILSAAMIVALMVPSSIGNIVTSAETAISTKTEQASEKTFSHKTEYPIQKGTDDAEVTSTAVNLTSTGLDLHGLAGATQATYLRFADVVLPSDAKISKAYISFTTRDASAAANATTISITGELGAQAAFTSTVASFTSRQFTETAMKMTTPVVAVNTVFNTNDVSSIVNEMRANTADIKDYVFKVTGSGLGSFVMRSYESNAAMAPKLVLEYTSASGEYKANIASTLDDAEEYGVNKTMDLNSAMEIGGYYSATLTPTYKNTSAFRFANVALPENAKIDDAYLEFTTYGTTANRVSNMSIVSELGNPTAYTSVAGNISNRNYTSSTVKYEQASFTTTGQSIRTPNLKSIIDETCLMGWQNGNALAFKVDGDNFIGSVYQGGSAVAYQPKLVIKYTYSENGAVGENVEKDPAQLKNIFINEVASMGTDAQKDGWIEVFNNNDVPVFFEKDVFISDEASALGKSELKNLYIPAKGYRIVKADGTANFTLGDHETTLYLATKYDDSFHKIDTFDVKKMAFGETMGRFNDGESNIVSYKPGTYESTNNDAKPIVAIALNQKPGMYKTGFDLTMKSDSVNTIKYTLDGTTPSETNGILYTGPITIDKTMTVKAYAYNAKQNSGVQTYVYSIREDAENIPLAKKEFSVKTGTDDAEVSATAVNLTSTGLDLHGLVGAVPQATFVRFTDVAFPADAVISKAYITFTTRDASSTPTNLTISGEVGNGSAFSSAVTTFTNRQLTNSTVKTTTPAKVAVNELVNTEDLAPVIDEMRAGNPDVTNLVFKIDGDKTGSYLARAYESNAAMAPKLVVEYYSGYGDFTGKVAAASDDAEEYGTAKAIDLGSVLEIGGYYSTNLIPAYKNTAALRFTNVAIPETAEIEDAYMEFTTYNTNAAKVSSNMEIRAELGNPETYKAVAGNITARNYTNLAVKYSQPAFTASNQIVRTANLKNIIDENRLAGWKNGQAMAFRIDGDNYIGSVYQNGYPQAAKLIVKYKNNGKAPGIDGALTTPDKIQNVYINELSSEGTASSKAAWIELYNDNDVPVILDKGMYLTDKAKTLDKFEFSNFLIPAKGYRILYSDKATELGNNHLNFEIGGSGDVILSAKVGATMKTVDSIKYTKQAYNQTFGRKPDASKNLTVFSSETFAKTNNDGQENYAVQFSKERGVYDTGFELSLSSKAGTTIKYTLDGITDPSATKGTVYTGPITISKTAVVKVYAYDADGNTGVISSTYVLRDNYKNEVTSGYQWQFKNTITSDEYAEAIDDFPIVSETGNTANLNATTYVPGTFEYLDTHMNKGGTNYVSYAGGKKFGQVSSGQYNSGVAVKFHRDYNAKKAKYNFFDATPGEAFPVVGKFSKLELKEGQDGPQNDIYNLGYNRYDEKVTNTLAQQMNKISLHARYVHYFYNGKYMGVKTMREDFGQNMFEEYFGGSDDDYTKIRFQDGYFVPGIVEAGDGDTNILTKVKAVAAAKNFQEFKHYVDVEDMIKMQILFMFVDTEREVDAVVSNDILNGNGVKMKFNINDTDGAFYNNGGTGTSYSALAGGGGTYRFKWLDVTSRRGAGDLFGNFSGDSQTATAGNLEFKTLVKDQVLAQIGPASGEFVGAAGAPLSVANVKQLIADNQKEIDAAYKLDAAYMGARNTMYKDWLNVQVKVQNQTADRVKYSLEMWAKYGMAHTLQSVKIVANDAGVVLENPNAGTDVYYTTDGSDPMGANGVVSSTATKYEAGTTLDANAKLTIRAFTTNNWGPLTK